MSGHRAFGPPATRCSFVRAPTTYEFFRFNRVEGLYLGVDGTLFLRDAFPGLALRGGVGYGFWDEEVKGGLVATLRRGPLVRRSDRATRARDRHQVPGPARLRHGHATNLRPGPVRLRRPATSDRSAAVTSWRSTGTAIIRADFGVVKDQATPQELSHGPLGQTYYPNPVVDAGTYFRSRLSLIWREDISSHFARPGIGAQVYLENGQGDFQYTSVNARLVGRANVAGLLLSFVGYGGVVTAPTAIPTQQLFLIGGRLHAAGL